MVMHLSAATFNRVMEQFRRNRPLPGVNMTLSPSSRGKTISFFPSPGGFKHPWTMQPSWSNATGTWQVGIVPGFVNWADVVIGASDIPLTAAVPPVLSISDWYDPLANNTPWPRLFELLGVPVSNSAVNEDGTQTVTVPALPVTYGTNRLMSADIVLHVDHDSVRTDLFSADPFTGNLTIAGTATLQATARYPYRLQVVPKWAAPVYPSAEEIAAGLGTAPNFDEILLGTLWMLSPPDADPAALPDPIWLPYPQHFLFWNLCFATLQQLQYTNQTPITLNTGLAGGLGDATGNAILSTGNDATAGALAAVNPSTNAGYFWTAP